jgi:hypothetical protein
VTNEAVYGVRSCPSRPCAEINHSHLHLTLDISADNPERDVFANACVFEGRGKVGGGLSASIAGGYDDVADGTGAWII